MMLHRDMRMVDTSIQGSLLNGVAVSASTSILLVGGLLAALGSTDQAVRVAAELPLAISTARAVMGAESAVSGGNLHLCAF